MRGLRRLLLLASFLALAGALAGAAPATHGRNNWSGQWTTNTGGVGFRWVTDSEGSSALKSQGGKACASPTDYFRGGYYTPSGGAAGKITGCTVGEPNQLVGRYVSDDKRTGGRFDIKFVSPDRFSGTYRNDGGGSGPYTGKFKAHFSGDGANHQPPGGWKVGFRFTQHGYPDGKHGIRTQTGGAGSLVFEEQWDGKGKPTHGSRVFHVDEIPGAQDLQVDLDLVFGVWVHRGSGRRLTLGFHARIASSDDQHCKKGEPALLVITEGFGGVADQIWLRTNCGTDTWTSTNPQRVNVHIERPHEIQ